jgi:glycosyltransferase involved in cell wall biosynthesis
MKVSIIIPTFESPDTLMRAIRSILAQTYWEIELIVVDDASRDNTEQVVFGLGDKRIKYVKHNQNKGVAGARNTGIKASSGEFIAFCDHDDEWFPNKLKLQLDIFRENIGSKVGLVYSNGFFVKKGSKNLLEASRVKGIVYSDEQRRRDIFPTSVVSPIPLLWLVPRNVISETGYFDERFTSWDDVDYFVRVALNHDIYYLDIPLAVHYELSEKHLGNLTVKQMRDKELYLNKYIANLLKDRNNLYRFKQKMGRDWLCLGNGILARKYFLEALKIKPYKLELLWRMIRTL